MYSIVAQHERLIRKEVQKYVSDLRRTIFVEDVEDALAIVTLLSCLRNEPYLLVTGARFGYEFQSGVLLMEMAKQQNPNGIFVLFTSDQDAIREDGSRFDGALCALSSFDHKLLIDLLRQAPEAQDPALLRAFFPEIFQR